MRASDEQKGIFFLALIALVMAGAAAYVALSMRTDAVAKTIESDRVIRALYVLDDGGEAAITEVVIYYPETKKAILVNIPENIGGIYESLGRADGIAAVYREKGIDAYKKEIETLTGAAIPFYTITTLQNFSRMADIMGGMRIFIHEPVDTVDSNGARILLPSGAVLLDGDKTVTYIKLRLPEESDAERMERRQNLMSAYFSQLNECKSKLFNKSVFPVVMSLSKMNIVRKDALKLLSLLSEMDSESIIRQSVTGAAREVDGKTLVFPRDEGLLVRQSIAQATNMLISTASAMATRVYVLSIQNGTTTQGLARSTAVLYQNASYSVLDTSNADRQDYEKTVVIDHIGSPEIARIVGGFIRCDNIMEEEVDTSGDMEGAADTDFTIILGKDFNGRYVVTRQ